MKKYCFFALLLLPCVLTGQTYHEIKTDFFPLINRLANVSYELVPTKHFGIEFGLGHRWGDLGFFNTLSAQPEYLSFDRNSVQAMVTGKFYIAKKAQGDRWFVGPFMSYEREISREAGYEQAYRENFGRPPLVQRDIRGGIGVVGGFKRVYKNGLLIELGMGYDLDAIALTRASPYFDVGGFFQIKLGYRLGKRVTDAAEGDQ
jgi:hypothetical protein